MNLSEEKRKVSNVPGCECGDSGVASHGEGGPHILCTVISHVGRSDLRDSPQHFKPTT